MFTIVGDLALSLGGQRVDMLTNLLDPRDMALTDAMGPGSQTAHALGEPAFGRTHPAKLEHDVSRMLWVFMEMIRFVTHATKSPAEALGGAPIFAQVAHIVSQICDFSREMVVVPRCPLAMHQECEDTNGQGSGVLPPFPW